jgi:ABC-type multidrug transport system permease subunit
LADRRGPIVHLTLSWFRESFRRPHTVFWLYVFPVLLVLVMGTVARTRSTGPLGVDVEDGPLAQATASILRQDPRLLVEIHAAEECQRRLRTGRTDLVVSISGSTPPAYAYHCVPGRAEGRLGPVLADELLQRAAGRKNVVDAKTVEVVAPGSRYIDFLVPGILGVTLMQAGLWGVGFFTVDLRLRKLLKRFVATPMHKRDFLIALMSTRLVLAVSEMLLILLVARVVFGVTSQGHWLDVIALIAVGTLSFSCIGLWMASRIRSLEAANGVANLIMLPLWIFSGVFFSPDRLPEMIQPVVRMLPLTPLISGLRAVMLEGAGLVSLVPQLSVLLAWTAVSFFIALRWFRWT